MRLVAKGCALAGAWGLALLTPLNGMADDLQGYVTSHDERIVRSRASEHGCINRGRTCYDYKEIRNYNDRLSDEERGNYEIDRQSRVRELHVFRKYRKIRSNDKVETTVVRDPHGQLRDVTLHTQVDSDVKARNGLTVGVYEGGRRRTSVRNTVRIPGDVVVTD